MTATSNPNSNAWLDPGLIEADGVIAMAEAAFQQVLQAAVETDTLDELDQVTFRACEGVVFAPASEFQSFHQMLQRAGTDLVVKPMTPARAPRAAKTTALVTKAAG